MRSNKNLYPGVNAHLNSYLQTESWESFHAEHIIDIRRHIAASLPPGYYARAEKSLQISEFKQDVETQRTTMKPDVTVYTTSEATRTADAPIGTPTLTIPFRQPFDSEKLPSSVRIYRIQADESLPGTPVTHIELLSPANKPGSTYYERYLEKRFTVVSSGINLIEIDYLHHTRPISADIPPYPHHAGSLPYMVLVSRPQPRQTAVFGAGALDELPIIEAPLRGSDIVTVDIGEIYNATVANLDITPLVVDYTTPPPAFDRYSEADRAAIHAFLDNLIATEG